MTKDEKRIKIAEACGWTSCQLICGDPMGRPPNVTNQFKHLPDYFNDLNAMHEAEKVLSDSETEQYNDLLGSYLWSGCPASRRNFHATAHQRAEAFGKTLNLW